MKSIVHIGFVLLGAFFLLVLQPQEGYAQLLKDRNKLNTDFPGYSGRKVKIKEPKSKKGAKRTSVRTRYSIGEPRGKKADRVRVRTATRAQKPESPLQRKIRNTRRPYRPEPGLFGGRKGPRERGKGRKLSVSGNVTSGTNPNARRKLSISGNPTQESDMARKIRNTRRPYRPEPGNYGGNKGPRNPNKRRKLSNSGRNTGTNPNSRRKLSISSNVTTETELQRKIRNTRRPYRPEPGNYGGKKGPKDPNRRRKMSITSKTAKNPRNPNTKRKLSITGAYKPESRLTQKIRATRRPYSPETREYGGRKGPKAPNERRKLSISGSYKPESELARKIRQTRRPYSPQTKMAGPWKGKRKPVKTKSQGRTFAGNLRGPVKKKERTKPTSISSGMTFTIPSKLRDQNRPYSQETGHYQGTLKVKRSIVSKDMRRRYDTYDQRSYKGNLRIRTNFGQKMYDRRRANERNGLTAAKIKKKSAKGDMHPSVAYLKGDKITNRNLREKRRKLNVFWVRLFNNKEFSKEARKKDPKPSYDKNERDIWTY